MVNVEMERQLINTIRFEISLLFTFNYKKTLIDMTGLLVNKIIMQISAGGYFSTLLTTGMPATDCH